MSPGARWSKGRIVTFLLVDILITSLIGVACYVTHLVIGILESLPGLQAFVEGAHAALCLTLVFVDTLVFGTAVLLFFLEEVDQL